MLTAAASAVLVGSVTPVVAQPDDGQGSGTVNAGGERVDGLLAEAERAVEAHNAVDEQVGQLREEVERRQERLARSQQRVNDQRRAIGSAAAAQYRVGTLDPALALLLADDPDGYLTRAAHLDRVGDRQRGELHGLLAAQRVVDQQRAEAGVLLAELEERRTELAERKREVQAKLGRAQHHLNRLTAEERAERERVERAARSESREQALGAAAPGASADAPSGRAAAAVEAARRALGRPYVWGSTGPHGFDCSGLTQWAYAQAGASLPRTSQGQAGAGRRVSLEEARPGDLVIYRDDASHVALYVGGGQVVHAPYPGASVRHDPVRMMPVSAVVRP
ncbi:C40 family peptidase [Streptomyces lonarensis]|uniref:C40 family peptidase n=2 Tax=Streptomyces lonarensis TaxID=700599 RepID=A0A7X6D0U9_9ACTN|nr:C40 family peptidase [Streptomyces lonarensis]